MLEVVTHRSWINRMGGAVKGVVFGGLLFLVAFPVLFLNEGRAVRTAKGLAEGAGSVVEVPVDEVDDSNEGKFVHVSGKATTSQNLTDDPFGVTFEGIRLNRNVEMYQWVETTTSKTKKKLGGGTKTVTVYDYEQRWVPTLVDSSGFEQTSGHENPTQLPYQQFQTQASDVDLGVFKLPKSLVDQIDNPESIYFDLDNLPVGIASDSKIVNDAPDSGQRLYILKNGTDAKSPQIGDVRVWFMGTPETEISVMAKQVANSFEPFQTHAGTQLNMLANEIVSAEFMIAKAEADNKALTWMLRILGIALMCGGIALVLKPLSVLGDVVPFVGTIIGMGTSLIALMVGTGAAFCTISLAWLFYRPMIGLPLLILGAGLIFWTIKTVRSRSESEIKTIQPVAAAQ